MPPDERNRFGRSFGEGYSYVALGFTFAFAILVFGALGWLVDGWLHTRPLFALVGAAIGGFGGFMSIYYRVQRDTQAGKREAGKGKGKA
jgi:F0F1-type ATP synthase assembly protein I